MRKLPPSESKPGQKTLEIGNVKFIGLLRSVGEIEARPGAFVRLAVDRDGIPASYAGGCWSGPKTTALQAARKFFKDQSPFVYAAYYTGSPDDQIYAINSVVACLGRKLIAGQSFIGPFPDIDYDFLQSKPAICLLKLIGNPKKQWSLTIKTDNLVDEMRRRQDAIQKRVMRDAGNVEFYLIYTDQWSASKIAQVYADLEDWRYPKPLLSRLKKCVAQMFQTDDGRPNRKAATTTLSGEKLHGSFDL